MGVSDVTTQAGPCQGQNEFVAGRKVEEERKRTEEGYITKNDE